MIGVVDYGGSPLFVLPTPGTDKPSVSVDDKPVVDIDLAGPEDPFLWRNESTMIFPGFYDTYLSASDWIYNIIDCDTSDINYLERCGEEIPDYYLKSWEDFVERFEEPHPKFYAAWEEMICLRYTRELWEYIQRGNKDNILTSMKFDHLWSPAYYNFETDKLVLQLTCNFDLLENWIQSRLDDFDKYLHGVWSSYDGFCSFVPNNYEDLVDSYWYRTICLEYYIRTQVIGMSYEESEHGLRCDDDYFYDSIEYKVYEWVNELSVEEVAARAEEMEDV